jgi:prophage regulatory protein
MRNQKGSSHFTEPQMIKNKPRVALATQQRQIATAIERVKAAADGEARKLTEEELAHIAALTAAVATLTRAINSDIDVAASAANLDSYRSHALARGPPPSGHEAILRWRAVSMRTGLSRPTIWRMVKQGRFPKSIQITGGHAVGWAASEVQDWIQNRIAQREQQEPRRSPVSRGRPRKAAAASASTPQT